VCAEVFQNRRAILSMGSLFAVASPCAAVHYPLDEILASQRGARLIPVRSSIDKPAALPLPVSMSHVASLSATPAIQVRMARQSMSRWRCVRALASTTESAA
jgi:hypothetical protein